MTERAKFHRSTLSEESETTEEEVEVEEKRYNRDTGTTNTDQQQHTQCLNPRQPPRCSYHDTSSSSSSLSYLSLLLLITVTTAAMFLFVVGTIVPTIRVVEGFALPLGDIIQLPSSSLSSSSLSSSSLLSSSKSNIVNIRQGRQGQRQTTSSSRNRRRRSSKLYANTADAIEIEIESMKQQEQETKKKKSFDIDTALFCAGLAFDSYVEPPPDSSRWERGSKGMNVAFVSSKYTRNLYRGMVEITPIEVTDLPEEDSSVESAISGNGVDVCLMCAVLEGKLWNDDLKLLEKDPNHSGIYSLNGAAHVGRSRTAWANVNIKKSNNSKEKQPDGIALPYHIPKTMFKSGKSVWPDNERPYYLYVQDPSNVQLIVTMFDDDVIGDGSVISSSVVSLKSLIPKVASTTDLLETIKQEIVQKMVADSNFADPTTNQKIDISQLNSKISAAISKAVKEDFTWEGELKMDTKPKIENKNSQIATGAAAGAMVAGPIGAAAGAAFGAFYEGQTKGTAKVRIRYLPVPPSSTKKTLDNKYNVLGGLPGINWGNLYEQHLDNTSDDDDDEEDESAEEDGVVVTTTMDGGEDKEIPSQLKTLGGKDLEFCFFITHDKTGASVGVYRSLEEKRIVVSFRGTCAPIDLVTDASIVQVPWIESEEGYDEQTLKNIDHQTFPMVHVGFRNSMDSIARRLKTLVLASVDVEAGHAMEDYEILVTGHSLGGALATLFTADIAEFGIDAGRSLPQKAPSDPWWKGIASTFGKKGDTIIKPKNKGPPRPRSLKMYNFGSPRAGNPAFATQFDSFIQKGFIQEAYRIVNSKDIIARVPRPMLNVDYEHCGRTVLIEEPVIVSETVTADDTTATTTTTMKEALWIEGESDFIRIDPVRDMRSATKGILSKGMLIDELVQTYKGTAGGGDAVAAADELEKLVVSDDEGTSSGEGGKSSSVFTQLGAVASRIKAMDVADLTSVVGIDRSYANREIELAQSFMKGECLAHHLEDSYYLAMGRAVGFNTTVGEDIVQL